MRRLILVLLFSACWVITSGFAQAANEVHPPNTPLVPDALSTIEKNSLTRREKQKLAHEVLDGLFGKLHQAKTARSAKFLAGAIWKLWSRSGSPTADLLLVQAERAMRAGQERIAVSILSTVIDQYPDFTEAWNKRATVYFILQDYDRSLADISEVLAREPRHFGALSGLGLIYQRLGKKKKALTAFRRALAIHPHLSDARRAIKRLADDVEQDI